MKTRILTAKSARTQKELVAQIIQKYPQHIGDLQSTGVVFARLAPDGSKKIIVHELDDEETVAHLQDRHGGGILVVLQKVCFKVH